MKKLFLFAMVAAALSGCSNSDEVDTNPEVQPGGEGYVGFSIQLPTVPGTRANDVFDDGTPQPDEYRVYNATLFIFKGDDETSATYESAYKMNVTNFNKVPDNNQCTTEGIVSSKVTKPTLTGSQKLFAYVIINDNGLADIANNKLGGTPYTTATTFPQFSQIVLNSLGDLNYGLVMTNAPVANYAGGATDPDASVTTKTLSFLDENKIFTTEAAAQGTPAAEIYMERAAAKVTVALSSSMVANPGISADPSVKFDKASIKWTLSNVNSTYYNTRQMKNDWLHYVADGSDGTPNSATQYRFISGTAIHTGVYRTYWGVDVNYTGNSGLTSAPGILDKLASDGTSVYTFENTFNVENQIVKNSTGIAISATFNEGKDFYTANTYGANKILQVPGAGPGEKIEDYIMKYLCNNNTEFKSWYDAGNRINVTMTNNTDGTAVVNTITKTSSSTTLPVSITPAYVNSLIKFQFYDDGVAYYNVLIKHFGDDETPWTRANHSANSVEGVYKRLNGTDISTKSEQLYLGRYGVVRNNWYKIELTGIRQIGSPTTINPGTGTGGDNPDDNVDNYLSVKIHITPWAVRKQSVEL